MKPVSQTVKMNNLISFLREEMFTEAEIETWVGDIEQYESLNAVVHTALNKFIFALSNRSKDVITVYPQFQRWLDKRAHYIVEEIGKINIFSPEKENSEEVRLTCDVLCLIRYLNGNLEDVKSVDDLWFWLVEIYVDLSEGLKELGLVN